MEIRSWALRRTWPGGGRKNRNAISFASLSLGGKQFQCPPWKLPGNMKCHFMKTHLSGSRRWAEREVAGILIRRELPGAPPEHKCGTQRCPLGPFTDRLIPCLSSHPQQSRAVFSMVCLLSLRPPWLPQVLEPISINQQREAQCTAVR